MKRGWLKEIIEEIYFDNYFPKFFTNKKHKNQKKKKKREEEDSYLSQQDRRFLFLHAEPRRKKILRQNQFRLKRQGH